MKITLLTIGLVCSCMFVNAQQTVKAPTEKVETKSILKNKTTTSENTAKTTVKQQPTTRKEAMLLNEPKKVKAVTKKNIK
ncbi:MAG: hypothetical protein ACI9J3_001573 [Parvicellaceae bacterium]|jgi:hypothetical protein